MKKRISMGLYIVAILFFIPIAYTFVGSFMTATQLDREGLQWIPEAFNLQQYYRLITDKNQYFNFMFNSMKIVFIIIVCQVVFGVFAAFALAKLKIPFKRLIMMTYLLTLLMPIQVTMVPNYLFFQKLEQWLPFQILNTHTALILPGAFSAFGIFLMKQFIEGIPDEIIEAAKIEGASTFRILFQIIIPIIKPGIHALIVLTFIDNWNIIETALVFISDEQLLPLSAFLEQIYTNHHDLYYAGATLYLIPAIFIFLKGEKYLEKGFSMGESDL